MTQKLKTEIKRAIVASLELFAWAYRDERDKDHTEITNYIFKKIKPYLSDKDPNEKLQKIQRDLADYLRGVR